jgi:effector-binding domain-containing protein
MIETPKIFQTSEQLLAVVRLKIPRSEIQHVMGPGISEVSAVLAKQGVTPTGRWLTHHFRMEPGVYDFEIALPIAKPIVPEGRVINSKLPAMTVARTIYHGGYEGLGGAWPKLDAWIAEQGRKHDGSLVETYLTDPSTSPDSSSWTTELTRRLV